ncbi:MAG: hypothetical protein US53_C0055G0005 [Candidatus Woesebacteria bacterium GW2011_GWA1_37_7]|uniref:WYL domain-containing protein n=1 Tax=Candidatus Woesebacteria bacterium GW2011_GWA1_37_7 TaxID=1618545 RepID=A0A0G0JHW7_9BACT|nr:MAG: hypothetical protein US53_C0055G0005 [Candidatus Woesebacteria bacterium GW2011_GWA1_37_7]
MITMKSNKENLKFEYKNWEGKNAVRKVEPIKIWFGKTQWHPKNQWFLKAKDLDKNEERDFALRDVVKFL